MTFSNSILATLVGILTGSITGLTPGIHVNTAIAFISMQKNYFTPESFVAFIVGASIAHILI